MTQPRVNLIPLRPAVRTDSAVTLDVLITITATTPDVPAERPPINLGLALDRSGSMAAHNKLNYARDAAIFAVQQLLPTDRVSVVTFDDNVAAIVANTPAADRERVIARIRRIEPGNSTALHGVWHEAAQQVRQHLLTGGLNRVLLLSDGLANVGETRPGAIATDVNRLARAGVSTTRLGLGDDYNEDLLQAMAQSGDGNYHYVETPRQLPDLFQTELHGLIATRGTSVSLGLEPQGGVEVADVLNELEKNEYGRLKLSNLLAGLPVRVVVRLQIPPMSGAAELCRFRLAWNEPGRSRQSLRVALRLPAVDGAQWQALAESDEVREQAALLLVARAKQEATRCQEKHDRAGAERWLKQARAVWADAPQTAEVAREGEQLAEVEADFAGGKWDKFQKRAKYQAHQRYRSQR
jgi:Ca-activated chloride channel family protein